MGYYSIFGSIAPYRGKAIMTSQIKVKDILDLYEIDSSINRDLGYHRLPKLVSYIDSFDSELGIFLPALVFSYRENPTLYWDKEKNTLNLPKGSNLIVLDGQHRIKGLEKYVSNEKIHNDKKKGILESQLTVQIYFGLTKEEERTLFTDINTNAKRVSRSLITRFDTRDVLNVLTRELYTSSNALKTSLTVEFEKARIVRPNNLTFITSVRLKKIIMILLFGESGVGASTPQLNKKEEKIIKENYDKIFSFLVKLFQLLAEALPENPGDVRKYVLGHEAIQNAIALYLYENIITESKSDIVWITDWEDVIEFLQLVNWSVKNRDWHPYMIVSQKGTKNEYMTFYDVYSYTNELKEIIKRFLN